MNASRQVDRDALRRELAPFRDRSTARGLTYFLTDIGVYLAAIAGVLLLPDLWMKIAASLVAGLKMTTLVAIGHDAAHNNTTASRWLNKVIAVISFTPALYNYALWLQDHHSLHHPHTNGDHPDTYKPFSKAAFDRLPAWRRALERFYRTPLGFGAYYILQRWRFAKLYPHDFMPQRIHASAWRHFAYLMAYLTLFVGGLAAAPLYAPVGSVTAVLLGFALPFYTVQTMFCFTLYLQHTHPDLPWFDGPVGDLAGVEQEDVTVHILFPGWFRAAVHNAFEHPAHHANPRIPFYRSWPAQQRLNELLGDRATITRFTLPWFLHCMRTCRLYDYVNHRWLDWDGTPTTGCVLKPHHIAHGHLAAAA